MPDPSPLDELVLALRRASHGDRAGALAVAKVAADAGSLLGSALVDHLDAPGTGRSVYDAPAAFRAFIRGGGNVELYRATSAHLAAVHRSEAPRTLLEIGPGDGLALLPALADGTVGRPATVTLVEPSDELLRRCAEGVAATGRAVQAQPLGIAAFLREAADRRWDLAESTFALHALEPSERDVVLAELAGRVGALTVVDFDVELPEPGTDGHLRELALRYERGLAEYDGDARDPVAQGFLLPVLLGQLAPGTPRATWEQPASAWRAQVERAGFTEIVVTPLAPYWWSPVFALTARGRR